MKKGTDGKVKFKKLGRALNMGAWQIKGLLQSIWDFAASNAPAGDIGRFSNDDIALAIGYEGEITPIIEALIATEWLDEHPTHRLVIHHWPEHCEESIHSSLARKRLFFADGTQPRLSKLSKTERSAAERAYKKIENHPADFGSARQPETAESGHKEPTYTCALPKPAPKPLPKPEGRLAGVFDDISEEDLADDAKLSAWFDKATSRRKPVIEGTPTNRLHVFASAERAIDEGNEPVGLFAWLIAGANWGHITQAQEERARKRLATFSRQRDGPATKDVVSKKFKDAGIKRKDEPY